MSTWGDVAANIAKAAPILGNLLPGVGTVAGVGVGAVASIVASALGTTPDPDAVMTALANDPDALVKLKTAEMENRAALQQLAVTAEANRLADVQNARSRQTANPKDYTPQFLAWGVTLGFFGALGCVMLAPLRQDVHDLLLVMIGALQTAWISVISYYFGSSKDSANKTQMIADVGYAAASAPVNVTTNGNTTQTTAAPQPANPALYRGR